MPLYIIATPIGNLQDISQRALDTLKDADVIACEDTRRSMKLLQHYSIEGKQLISYGEHNENSRTKHLLNILQENKSVALISDSGTPLISDPGYLLVRAAHRLNIPVISIPGPSALTAALSISGLPTSSFSFHSFFPKENKKRNKLLEKIKTEQITHVFYESPHRMAKTLSLLNSTVPEKEIAICRELTKMHEEVIRGSIKDIHEKNQNRKWLGEFVIIIY